jgi:glycosyltransferase involved in cell wall biosynthesis
MENSFLSIIVPTTKREESLICLLNSFLVDACMKYLNKFEIIVVNDGSVYPKQVINKYVKILPLKYFEIEHLGPAAARNFAVNNSKGSILAFTDDDCAVKHNWIGNIFEYFNKTSNVIAVGGSIKTMHENNNMINKYLSATKHLDGPIIVDNKIINMASANLIVKKINLRKLVGLTLAFQMQEPKIKIYYGNYLD